MTYLTPNIDTPTGTWILYTYTYIKSEYRTINRELKHIIDSVVIMQGDWFSWTAPAALHSLLTP